MLIEAAKVPRPGYGKSRLHQQVTEHSIRAVGGEIPDLYPVKALIKP
jgi:hypothetical protein